MQIVYKVNNFDIIRLFAALEVAISHTVTHLDIQHINSIFLQFLHLFPGVPIFFFISGFLISKSYENSRSIKQYAKNRILRIYPALIMVTLIGILSVYVSGYFNSVIVSIREIIVWFVAQTTIIQFYNPGFLRGYGVGVLNGSLWTISVELQFYIITPLLYFLFMKFEKYRFKQLSNMVLYVCIVLSMIIHFYFYQNQVEYANTFLYKLIGVSFLPWFYMFAMGIFFQRNFLNIYLFIENKKMIIIMIYLILVYIFGLSVGNAINPLLFIFLAFIIFIFAYTYPSFSDILLKGNDISYGVYIYHMILVNLFIYYGFISNLFYAVIIICLSLLIAGISWIFIEKPILRLKQKSIHLINIKR